MKSHRGTSFDPDVVDSMINAASTIHKSSMPANMDTAGPDAAVNAEVAGQHPQVEN
ncbi:MAG: hypothetical protein R2861_04235 [Desulfobacterales bacterium]